MRLSIAILLLTLVFLTKGNELTHQRCADVLVTELVGQKKSSVLQVSDLITKKSTQGSEVKKEFQSVPGYILQSLFRFSSTSIEGRHFLDTFFVSFFTYFTSHNDYANDSYLNQLIAINKKLKIIYPHHSFW